MRIFEACGASIADLREEHGHRVLRVRGKGGKVVLVPLPPAVARAIDRAVDDRTDGPVLRNALGARMDRHAVTRRLKHLAASAGIRMPRIHPHMLRHTFVTTMLDAGVSLRDVQIAARHADPRTTMRYDRARKNLDRHPNHILAVHMASGTVTTGPRLSGQSVSSSGLESYVRWFVSTLVANIWLDYGSLAGEHLAVTTPVAGWRQLNRHEYLPVWDRFDRGFNFRASIEPSRWPAIAEPVPSLTWDLAASRHDFDERWRSGQPRFAVDEDGVNRLIMAALRDCVAEDEWVYVLDWQHPGYRCWPHRVDPDLRTDMWPVQVFPDGDYYIFTSPDLRFGTFGHPWEATLCVWGAELIDAVEAHNTGILTRLYRRDGRRSDGQ